VICKTRQLLFGGKKLKKTVLNKNVAFYNKNNIVLFQYNKKIMQNYKTTKSNLKVHSRGDIQIWSCLVLTRTPYLFKVNFGRNYLNCIQWIYLVLQITTSQVCMFLPKNTFLSTLACAFVTCTLRLLNMVEPHL